MTKRFSLVFLFPVSVVAAGLSVGCVRPQAAATIALSSHTLAVGPDQTADVVWIESAHADQTDRSSTVLRCHNAPTGPVCRRAELQ